MGRVISYLEEPGLGREHWNTPRTTVENIIENCPGVSKRNITITSGGATSR
jgi:hypothetical protein